MSSVRPDRRLTAALWGEVRVIGREGERLTGGRSWQALECRVDQCLQLLGRGHGVEVFDQAMDSLQESVELGASSPVLVAGAIPAEIMLGTIDALIRAAMNRRKAPEPFQQSDEPQRPSPSILLDEGGYIEDTSEITLNF
ncbi:hypothetical protein [Novosphingobium sp. Leaf2]|uniref:hypothetical protein n=1 Tax=Novosphingobium sp. Leaf2 TaxID=1735670 RepID=UPI0012E24241|nr:hypothetical protein [Novosphingobium sp. Leaf2]